MGNHTFPAEKGSAMTHVSYATLHEKLDVLLEELGVSDGDASGLNPESAASLHAKVDALCVAHGGDPAGLAGDTLAQLHPSSTCCSQTTAAWPRPTTPTAWRP
jgi:hypothetical protein